MTMTVTLRRLENADAAARSLFEKARELLEQALNHPEFAARVGGADYRESRYRRADGTRTEVAPSDIHPLIVASGEGRIMLEVVLVEKPSGVLGSTELGRQPIHTATWFASGCAESGDSISLARHLIHEWLHVAGFYHYPGNRARKDVPYNVGEIVQDLLAGRGGNKAAKQTMAQAFEDGACGQAEESDAG